MAFDSGTATETTETRWRPNPRNAALLALVAGPFALLYALRPWWALFYAVALFGFGFLVERFAAEYQLPFTVSAAAVIALHAYSLAASSEPAMVRPWYSRASAIASAYTVVLVGFLTLRAFAIEHFRVPGLSMEPTIPTNSFITITKWGYGHYTTYGLTLHRTDPSVPIRRGDVVAFETPEDRPYIYVGRVVGLPGDTLRYAEKQLTIDGIDVSSIPVGVEDDCEIREETLGDVRYRLCLYPERSAPEISVRLGADQYFLMGDSRDNSKDSRHFGPIPARNFVGRVVDVR